MADLPIQWLTTAPNPRARRCGADDGQRGWRQHAVRADPKATFASIANEPALCGLTPAHGWSIDLFAESMQRCARCHKKAGGTFREAIGEGSSLPKP